MQLVAPDILDAAVGLSPALCVTGFLIGALLWFVGGLTHRFWVVLGSTLIAGIVGLFVGKRFDMQPLVAGLLLAVSIGALALALFRIVLFIASGSAVLWLAGAVAPSWDEPIACFLAGGLLGIAMYNMCVIALSSFGGTLLMSYSGLLLASAWGNADVVALAEKHGPLLDWGVGTVTVLGILVQFLIQRRRKARAKQAKADEQEELMEETRTRTRRPEKKPSLWERVMGQRKAG
jgi:MFS family permease